MAPRQATAHDLFAPTVRRDRPQPKAVAARLGREPRIGLIHNARARHNIGRHVPLLVTGCDHVMPQTHDELHDVVASFVAKGIDTVIIDGGDGTVRDVLSVISRYFPAYRPRLAIVPSGKTNALALDLGISADWTLDQAVHGALHSRVEERAPIEVWRDGADRPELSGFIFGAGAFVRATQTAQKTHRIGAFNGAAVGLSIAAAVGQSLFGGAHNPWRRGEVMQLACDGGAAIAGPQYLVLASTLRRMPLGIKPFGAARAGLKMLRIAAPPVRIAQAVPAILMGLEWAWLRRAGYDRQDARRIDVTLDNGFVLDGETFDGGRLSLRQGAPLSFIVP